MDPGLTCLATLFSNLSSMPFTLHLQQGPHDMGIRPNESKG